VPKQTPTPGKRVRRYPNTPAEVIEQYNPLRAPVKACSEVEWSVVGPIVRSAMAPFGSADPKTVSRLMSAMTKLAVWALREGYDLDLEALLDGAVIEAFAATLTSSQATWRSSLRSIAKANQVETEETLSKFARPVLQGPYETSEVAALMFFARALSNKNRAYAIEAAVLLGAGAGIARGDLRSVTAANLHDHDGALHVAVAGRCVPVLPGYDDELRALAAKCPNSPLIGKVKGDEATVNITRWVGVRPGTPAFSTDRLRATFICTHLNMGTGTRELLAITGLNSIDALDSYYRFVEPLAVECDVVSRGN